MKSQSGQLMIVVAVGMVAFLSFAAIVLDLGYAYSQRRLAQNASDAAAMAGIRMVRMRTSSTTATMIHNEIARVAGLNGNSQVVTDLFLDVSGNSLGAVASYGGSLGDVAGVRVIAQKQYNTFFAGLLGFPTLTSGGKAAAMSMAISGVSGSALAPIAVRQESFVVGTEYTIWDEDKEAAGNAGWLDLNGGGGGTSELASWLAGSPGFKSSDANEFEYYTDNPGPSPGSSEHGATLPFPSWVLTSTGNKTAALSELYVGESITVIVYTNLYGTGNNAKYRAVGLAQFTLTAIDPSGSDKQIRGTFQRMVLPGEPSATPTTSEFSTVRMTN